MVQNLSLNSAVNAKQPKTTTLATQAVEMNKNLAAIVEKLDDLVNKVSTPQQIEINFNITILLIIFNFFIPWWLYRDRNNRLDNLIWFIKGTHFYESGVRELKGNPELLNRFQAIFEAPDYDSFTLEKEELSEEEQKWQERASMIQDLYRDLEQSLIVKSPSEDINSMRSDITEVRSQIDQLLNREQAGESRLEGDIAQLISGDFPQPTPEALTCIHQLSLIEDLICEEPFNLQKTIESLEDYRNNLEPSLVLLARDPELQQEYQNAFNPAGWSDSFEVRSQHFLELQFLRLRILQYFASTEETGETPTQEL